MVFGLFAEADAALGHAVDENLRVPRVAVLPDAAKTEIATLAARIPRPDDEARRIVRRTGKVWEVEDGDVPHPDRRMLCDECLAVGVVPDFPCLDAIVGGAPVAGAHPSFGEVLASVRQRVPAIAACVPHLRVQPEWAELNRLGRKIAVERLRLPGPLSGHRDLHVAMRRKIHRLLVDARLVAGQAQVAVDDFDGALAPGHGGAHPVFDAVGGDLQLRKRCNLLLCR